MRRIFAFVFVLLALLSAPAAFASQLGPRTNYTADQIQAAVERANGYNGSIMSQAGNLGMFESSGNSGIYNDTCCTGIFQINKSNLASYGLTPSQYANMSLDEQAQVWVNVTNSAAGAGSVKQLEQMQASGQKFDGQPVDTSADLPRIVAATPPGSEVSMSVWREGEQSERGACHRSGAPYCGWRRRGTSGGRSYGDTPAGSGRSMFASVGSPNRSMVSPVSASNTHKT